MAINDGREQPFDLREYLSILRTRKLIIIATTLGVLSLAMLFSWRQTPLYQAEATVLVHPLTSSPTATTSIPVPLNLETERQIASSAPVAERVVKDLALDESSTQLLEDLDVTGVTDSEVLVLGYTAPSAGQAQEISNSFAQNYVDFRRSQALDSLLSAQRDIKKRIDSDSSRLSDLTGQIADARAANDRDLTSTLNSQRTALIVRLGSLQERYDNLQPESSITVAAGQVIQPAIEPLSASSPDYKRNGAGALVLGFGLGIFLAFTRERLDDRFRGSTDVEQAMRVPVLATVPKFKVETGRRRKDTTLGLVVARHPQGMAAEAFRTLRTNLQFAASQRGTKTFVVSSASAKEGKSSITANLGIVLAKTGKRVVLISADMRKPTLERYFGVGKHEGLATWLAGEGENPWEIAHDSAFQNVKVVPCGPVPADPAELLTSRRFVELVNSLEESSDVILIDSPPILPVADASIMAAKVGDLILVINSGFTTRSTATRARDEIERAGVSMVGSVLNAFDPTTSSYNYGRNYGAYAYAQPSPPQPNGNGHPTDKPSNPKTRSLFGSRR